MHHRRALFRTSGLDMAVWKNRLYVAAAAATLVSSTGCTMDSHNITAPSVPLYSWCMYFNDCQGLESGEQAAVGGGISNLNSDWSPFNDYGTCGDFKEHLLSMESGDEFTTYLSEDGADAWGVVGGTGISIYQPAFSYGNEQMANILLHESRHNLGEDHPFSPTNSEAMSMCGSVWFALMHLKPQVDTNFITYLTRFVAE